MRYWVVEKGLRNALLVRHCGLMVMDGCRTVSNMLIYDCKGNATCYTRHGITSSSLSTLPLKNVYNTREFQSLMSFFKVLKEILLDATSSILMNNKPDGIRYFALSIRKEF